MSIKILKKEISTTIEISSISIIPINYRLGITCSFIINFHDEDDKIIKNNIYTLTDEEFDSWENDENIISLVLNKYGMVKIDS